MSEPLRSTRAAQGKLFLIFQVGAERFALAATDIGEVLPCVPLKPVAQAPAWVVGIFAHRGRVVPVIDVGQLMFGTPAPQRTSTRLVLVHYRSDPARPDLRLGLILEHATHTLRCNPDDFRPSEVSNRTTPYLGPVREDEQGLLQWVGVQDLLDERVRELLFAPQLADRLKDGED
ncbi:CheW protein [Pseudomonas sp. M47T1]|uniref:chemotaxis protein CheW n=1 Tax=unclassified Pseudomonas TaxID=196821 RepID=UPI0002607F9E|nr:chemotaxis protein CheW [Pseudomonas sp. M47T1]EIK97780.1 CheW protein [Pseudomonas sp. M47T1]